MFDLNRLTIRGALSRLTAEGLLTVRREAATALKIFIERWDKCSQLALALAQENSARTSMIEDVLTLRRHLARAALIKIAAQPDPHHMK